MKWYGFAFVPVNLLFLSLGILLVIFSQQNGIALPENSDDLFPGIVTGGYVSPYLSAIFMLGLVAAAYSSAESALTSLTTSFSVDILGFNDIEKKLTFKKRILIHLGLSGLIAGLILLFRQVNNQAVVSSIFMVAGYTYGPLLGVYFAGLFTKIKPNDRFIPLVMVLSPLISVLLYDLAKALWNYNFGFEMLLINGFITFIGLLLVMRK